MDSCEANALHVLTQASHRMTHLLLLRQFPYTGCTLFRTLPEDPALSPGCHALPRHNLKAARHKSHGQESRNGKRGCQCGESHACSCPRQHWLSAGRWRRWRPSLQVLPAFQHRCQVPPWRVHQHCCSCCADCVPAWLQAQSSGAGV